MLSSNWAKSENANLESRRSQTLEPDLTNGSGAIVPGTETSRPGTGQKKQGKPHTRCTGLGQDPSEGVIPEAGPDLTV